MRGHEQRGSTGCTIATPLPAVSERLIQRRPTEERVLSIEESIVIECFGSDHKLSEEEIMRVAFVYAKAYKNGVDSLRGGEETTK